MRASKSRGEKGERGGMGERREERSEAKGERAQDRRGRRDGGDEKTRGRGVRGGSEWRVGGQEEGRGGQVMMRKIETLIRWAGKAVRES